MIEEAKNTCAKALQTYVASRDKHQRDTLFPRVWECFRHKVYSLAMTVLENSADAYDATQEAFHDFVKDADKIKDPTTARAWLLQVARNRSNDIGRYRGRNIALSLDDRINDMNARELPDWSDEASPAGSLEAKEEVARLQSLIDELPLKQREVLELYRQDFRLDEIADILSIPIGTVRSRLSRALLALRDEMRER